MIKRSVYLTLSTETVMLFMIRCVLAVAAVVFMQPSSVEAAKQEKTFARNLSEDDTDTTDVLAIPLDTSPVEEDEEEEEMEEMQANYLKKHPEKKK